MKNNQTIKLNGKVIKLSESVKIYLNIIGATIDSFNKKFMDPYDEEQYIIGFVNPVTNYTLGISLDGNSYTWFDKEHYNVG